MLVISQLENTASNSNDKFVSFVIAVEYENTKYDYQAKYSFDKGSFLQFKI
jgi:hypothetical protein